jgi:hypothetical protein
MLTIGFTTVYYTLWNVNSFMKSKAVRGEVKWYLCTEYQYLRNLSLNLDKAKEKIMSLGPQTQYNIDLTLHGTKWFETEKEVHIAGQERDYTFTFGRFRGQDIRSIGEYRSQTGLTFVQGKATSDSPVLSRSVYLYIGIVATLRREIQDFAEHIKFLKDVAWQLDRAVRMESTARRKVYARRRLIELGELIRRDWFERVPIYDAATCDNPDSQVTYREVKRKWMPRGLAKWHDQIGSKKGLFYSDKERRKLTIRQVKSKMLPSEWGTMYIVDYMDNEGHIVTYKGGSPIPEYKKGEPFEVTATIKHASTFHGQQTFIQRIKYSNGK